MDTQATTRRAPLGGRPLTRRGLLLGSAASALALAGCGGGSDPDMPWEAEPRDTAGLWGYVDASGGWAIAPRWGRAGGFQDGAALVAWVGDDLLDRYVGVTDASGRLAFEPLRAHDVGGEGGGMFFSCGLVSVAHSSWRYMDRYGSFLGDGDGRDDGRFYYAGPFNPPDAFMGRPYALASADGNRWGVLGADGGWLLRPAYEGRRLQGAGADARAALLPAGSGPSMDSGDVLWGYIAPDGSWAIEPTLAAARPFVGLLAPARDASGGLWGGLAPDGSWAVAPAYAAAHVRDPGAGTLLARDAAGGLWGLAGAGGWAAAPSWSECRDLAGGGLLARDASSGLWGVPAADGTWAVPPRWQDVGGSSEGEYAGTAAEEEGGRTPARDPSSGLWGLAGAASGEWALAPTFRSAPWFVGPDSLGAQEGGPDSPCGVADASTGEWSVTPGFRSIGRFADNGLAPAQSDG